MSAKFQTMELRTQWKFAQEKLVYVRMWLELSMALPFIVIILCTSDILAKNTPALHDNAPHDLCHRTVHQILCYITKDSL